MAITRGAVVPIQSFLLPRLARLVRKLRRKTKKTLENPPMEWLKLIRASKWESSKYQSRHTSLNGDQSLFSLASTATLSFWMS